MKFGLSGVNFGPGSESAHALWLAEAAERLGYESIWAAEHVVMPVDLESKYPFSPDGNTVNPDGIPRPASLIWLAHVAAVTKSIKLATGVLVLPQRNPVILAKELATLDRLSGGRLVLGIGVGWLREEMEILQAPFHERGRRADEYIQTLRALWGPQPSEFEGTYNSVPPVYCVPRPVGDAGIPIIVGGNSDAAARRAGRLGDGLYMVGLSGAELASRIALARATAEECGRDPAALEITLLDVPDADVIAQARSAGVDRFLVNIKVFPRPPVEADLAGFAGDFIDRS